MLRNCRVTKPKSAGPVQAPIKREKCLRVEIEVRRKLPAGMRRESERDR